MQFTLEWRAAAAAAASSNGSNGVCRMRAAFVARQTLVHDGDSGEISSTHLLHEKYIVRAVLAWKE